MQENGHSRFRKSQTINALLNICLLIINHITMQRIITFIAALAFVSGGIISAQEQEREQVQEQEPIREYSKFRFGLEGGGGFRLGKISNDVRMTSNPTRRNLEEDSCMEPMRLGSSRSLWELVFATRRSRPAMARR